jgi:transcriptional regulator with XRE-family HTH domain
MKGEPYFKGLRALRIAKGLSQQQLAELLGMSLRQVHRYEAERTRPRTEDVTQRLCEIFDCHWLELMGLPRAA